MAGRAKRRGKPCSPEAPVAEQYTTRALGSFSCSSRTLSPTCAGAASRAGGRTGGLAGSGAIVRNPEGKAAAAPPGDASTLPLSERTSAWVLSNWVHCLLDVGARACCIGRPVFCAARRPQGHQELAEAGQLFGQRTCVGRVPASGTKFLALWPATGGKDRRFMQRRRQGMTALLALLALLLAAEPCPGHAQADSQLSNADRVLPGAQHGHIALLFQVVPPQCAVLAGRAGGSLSSKTMRPSKSLPHHSASCLKRLRPLSAS